MLQDNGGDNLTVTGDGPFTFATPLASGAAYDATVATSPAGQSCTVSGGTGTITSASVTGITITCTDNTATTASDDFGRADGSLGPNWTDLSYGGLAISSQAAVGTNGSGLTGDAWTADVFGSDQYSQIELTSTQLTGGQWIAAAVRSRTAGRTATPACTSGTTAAPN